MALTFFFTLPFFRRPLLLFFPDLVPVCTGVGTVLGIASDGTEGFSSLRLGSSVWFSSSSSEVSVRTLNSDPNLKAFPEVSVKESEVRALNWQHTLLQHSAPIIAVPSFCPCPSSRC